MSEPTESAAGAAVTGGSAEAGGTPQAGATDLLAAEEEALADGFSLAVDLDVAVSRDGAGTAVVDVPCTGWTRAAWHAHDALGLDFIDWLSAVDEPDAEVPGLDVVLHVAATSSTGVSGDHERERFARVHGGGGGQAPGPVRVRRLMLRTRVPETALRLASLTRIWPGVAWHERETFEMFGLMFTSFDDASGQPLRPLLLPEGFEGTPLRKSFVLAARAAKAWPGAKDPADSGARSPSRRKIQPPGVPDPTWGPREAEVEPGDAR